MDSIAQHFEVKPKFSARFDSINSFVESQNARIFGIKIGWEYNDAIKLGIGYNRLDSKIAKPRYEINKVTSVFDTLESVLKFEYLSPFFEYVFFKTKRWEHAIPVQIGIGNSRYEYVDKTGIVHYENYRPVVLYEPAMTTQFKIFQWIGLGAGVGYRLILVGNRQINENLNSPIYVLRIKVFLGDLYRGVKNVFIPPNEGKVVP
ncbi:MAG: hypothetical protein ACK4ON_03335 [Bacteroidia bacterium]